MLRRRRMMFSKVEKEYIIFADPEVERLCIANWSSDHVGVTLEDAARVTTLAKVFNNNSLITSFDELQYFTGLAGITASGSSNNTGGAFYHCTSLTSIVLPPNITYIGKAAFIGCSNLVSIGGFPDTLRTIQNYAFDSCSKLVFTSLNKVTSVQSYAFRNCEALVSVTAPYLVSTGGTSGTQYSGSFGSCDNLAYVDFGSSFTTLAYRTFDTCKKLDTIIMRATSAPTIQTNAFRHIKSTYKIYVPYSSDHSILSAYQTAWSSYASHIYELDENGDIPT